MKTKLCECGCGQPAPISTQTRTDRGQKKGNPVRFIYGHAVRVQPTGKDSYRWNGGITNNGVRCLVHAPGHPRASERGYVLRSLLVAEAALGRPIIPPNVVHHTDENKFNDDPANLVVCENNAYHRLLHQRKRAYDACGNASWRKCYICREYDAKSNLYIPPYNPKGGNGAYHKKCISLKQKAEYRAAKQLKTEQAEAL